MYPNPVISELNVETDASAIVELYTVDGRLVYQSNMGESHFAIDMQHYVAGLYLLKVKMNDHERTFKIIKD